MVIQEFLLYSLMLLLASFGGRAALNAGRLNVSLEGSMVCGALACAVFLRGIPVLSMPLLFAGCVLLSFVSGALFALLPAAARKRESAMALGFGADLFIVSSAVIAARALSLSGQGAAVNYLSSAARTLFLVDIGPLSLNLFLPLAAAVLLVCFFLYRSRFGIQMRAGGEDSFSAASFGIRVNRNRFIGMMISGGMCGLAGLGLLMTSPSWNFRYGAMGFGFAAYIMTAITRRHPFRLVVLSVLFGAAAAFGYSTACVDLRRTIGIPEEVSRAIPFILALLLCSFIGRNDRKAVRK